MTKLRNRYFFVSDLVFLLLASYLSYVLRLEGFDLGSRWLGWLLFTALALLVIPSCFWLAKLYSRYWLYASIDEFFLLTGIVTCSTVGVGGMAWVGSLFLPVEAGMPRSIPFIFLLLALAGTAAPRVLVRLVHLYRRKQAGISIMKSMIPVLVIGAGDAGSRLVRELQHNPQFGMEPVGFLDDDPRKRNLRICGLPVFGDRYDLPTVVKGYHVRRVVIAIPSAPGSVLREWVALCEQTKVETRTLPSLEELLNGNIQVNQIREVNIEDLLRRKPVRTNTTDIQMLVEGQSVMVTGGGGSIGSELCRQLALFEPSSLLLLDHSENSVFHMINELKKSHPQLELVPLIADIRDRSHLEMIYQRYQPALVFHAAAHKHVPLMEANPCEAIINNVLGTKHLVELADAYGVEHFVMISTDKAVNPTSVMGASKRCAERVVQQVARRSQRPYVAVRFGNVLGSNGSVVPFFKSQIAAGGPVTVTHPEMRRFFMTIPEAVQLVLQAAALGNGGEVFVLDMGEPVYIKDLARDLIILSGLEPDKDIKIEFIGVRPGEKLFEELFVEGEVYERTRHQKIFVVQGASEERADPHLDSQIRRLVEMAIAREGEAIRPLLQEAVPEYQPAGNGAAGFSSVALSQPPLGVKATSEAVGAFGSFLPSSGQALVLAQKGLGL